MLDVLDSPATPLVPEGTGPWHTLIDELLAHDLSEDEFVVEVCNARVDSEDAAWSAVAALDQRFRRGQVPVELFRSIGAKISQRELKDRGRSNTIKLRTYRWRPAAAKPASTCTTPQAHRFVGPSLADPQPMPRIIEAGRVLRDRYVLEKTLGSGGMGTVYKALDRFRADLRDDGRHVAVKILHDSVDGDDMTRLRREFFCAQALSHPNIIKVYELDRDDDVAFFTMELLEGKLLSALIEDAQPRALPRTLTWTVIRDVGAALAYAHSRQVVHGDLKPQNIMITNVGEVRILDFGASSDPLHTPGDASASGHPSELTPAYACSELLQGQAAEPADDLYALACLSYELLAGAHPFGGHTATEARELGLAPWRPPALTDRQWRALGAGLACNREDRSASVSDWILDIMPAPAQLPPAVVAREEHAPPEVAPPEAPAPGSSAVAQEVESVIATVDAKPDVQAVPQSKHAEVETPTANPEPPKEALVARELVIAPPPEPDLVIVRMTEASTVADQPAAPEAAPALTALPVALGTRTHAPAPEVSAPRLPVWVLARPASARSPRLTNSALMFALLICATLWAAIAPPWSKVVLPERSSSPVQILTAIAPLPATVDPQFPAQLVLRAPAVADAAEQGSVEDGAVPAPPPKRLRFSADSYHVYAGQRFAELHIVRSPGWDDDANFVWWTEGGSARAGVDYVPQNPAVQFMPRSQRRATLFVKVASSTDRGGRRTFFVAMTDPRGRSLSGVVRARVTISLR